MAILQTLSRIGPRAFPTTPADGDEHTEGGKIYRWDAAINGWRLVGVVSTEARFEYPVSPAATTWTIPHNMGIKYVSAQAIDSAGNTIVGDIDWTWSTTSALRLIFANAKEGVAIIRR